MKTWMPRIGLIFGLLLAAAAGWSIYQQIHSGAKIGMYQEQPPDAGASE